MHTSTPTISLPGAEDRHHSYPLLNSDLIWKYWGPEEVGEGASLSLMVVGAATGEGTGAGTGGATGAGTGGLSKHMEGFGSL